MAKTTTSKKTAPKSRKKKDDSLSGVSNSLKEVLNVRQSEGAEKDWKMENAVNAGIIKAVAPDEMPAEIDLREKWWTIDNQDNTNSCVGFAVAGSLLHWHFVNAGRIEKDKKLSARFIWMAAKETDEWSDRPATFIEQDGTSIKSGLDVARKFGCVEEGILPFNSNSLYRDGSSEDFYARASRYKINSYFNINLKTDSAITDLRRWIATKGPVAVRVRVDATWWELKTRHDGILDNYVDKENNPGHAVALCGFTRDRFIIRNCWGDFWGDKGYAYASDDYIKKAITEAYGIHI